jgi:hypothetical protein
VRSLYKDGRELPSSCPCIYIEGGREFELQLELKKILPPEQRKRGDW